MSTYNLNLTLENIRTITVMLVDIFVMWLVLYYAIKLVRSSSRTIQIFKGIILILILDGLAKLLGLKTLAFFTDIFLNWGFLAIIIIFQPEIRSLLERLGKTNMFSRISTLTGNEKENLVDQIVKATMLLSQDQTGALISIEQSHSLSDFVATGTKLNSDVTAELLTSIFVTSTPLHDGAVIIQGDKIACASAYFPPTNLELPSRFGARHRAAIGISEITDAVTIVVSEETGNISITEGGQIFKVNRKQLREYLLRVICGEETEISAHTQRRTNPTPPPAREILIDDTEEIRKQQVEAQKKEAEQMKRQETGVINRLALKKQEAKVPVKKIQTEDVTPAKKELDSPDIQIVDEPEEKKKSSGFFGGLFSHEDKKNLDEEDKKMEELEDEVTEIKLPRKKDRPVPSYPENSSTHRFEKPTSRVAEKPAPQVVKQPNETLKQPTVQPETVTRKATPIKPEQPVRRVEPIPEEKVAPAPRMTPEQVRAAREATKMKFSSKAPTRPYENTPEKIQISPEERKYDTSKINVSKLMHLDDGLDETLSMVDKLDDLSDKSSEKDKGVK